MRDEIKIIKYSWKVSLQLQLRMIQASIDSIRCLSLSKVYPIRAIMIFLTINVVYSYQVNLFTALSLNMSTCSISMKMIIYLISHLDHLLPQLLFLYAPLIHYSQMFIYLILYKQFQFQYLGGGL